MAHPRRADMFVGVLYVTVRAGPPRQNEHARPQGLWRLQDPGADGQPGFSATSERDNMRGGRFVISYLYEHQRKVHWVGPHVVESAGKVEADSATKDIRPRFVLILEEKWRFDRCCAVWQVWIFFLLNFQDVLHVLEPLCRVPGFALALISCLRLPEEKQPSLPPNLSPAMATKQYNHH